MKRNGERGVVPPDGGQGDGVKHAPSPRPLSSHFNFWLPMPPSLNNAYFNAKGGRRMSTAYRDWKDEAVYQIYVSVPADKRIAGPVCIAIALPEKMRGDVDNRIKPILDALVASGRIDDDRNVIEVSAGKRLADKDRAFVSVSASLRKAAA